MASGHKCKLYYNTGTYAIPVWVLVPGARDVDFPITPDKIEESDRSSDWKKYTEGMLDTGINFSLTYRNGNAQCELILAAIVAGTVYEWAAMDGAIATTGSQGIRFFGKIFSASKKEPLADGQTLDCEVAPTYFEEASAVVDPVWYEVS